MATAVKERTTRARKGLRAAAGYSARNDREPMHEDWLSTVYPARYVVRTIDLKMVGGKLVPSFRDSSYVQPLAGQDITDIARTYVPQTRSGPIIAPSGLPVEFATSTTNPLDLQLKNVPTYIIFVLGEPSNLQFNPTLQAMTHKNSNDLPHYGLLRHVTATDEDEDPLDDCYVIYFIAKPLTPPQPDYKHGFNMCVRLASATMGEDHLDLELDPDIRYPGGSPTEP